MSIALYSVDGLAETIPLLEIITDGETLALDLRHRLVDCSIKLDRRKRPKADLTFVFESMYISLNDETYFGADLLPEIMPLDAKIEIRLGYEGMFKKFGLFDVVEHKTVFTDGGITTTVYLEGFGIAKHASDYRVYSSGGLFDLFREVANRNDLEISNAEYKAGLANFQESLKNVANQISSTTQEGSQAESQAQIVQKLLQIDPDDPFVQVGESDEEFLRRLAEYYGMSVQFNEEANSLSFITLFHVDKDADLDLRYGDSTSNLRKISFNTSKTRTSNIRQRTKPDTLQQKVPKRGKAKDTPEPVEDQEDATQANRKTRSGGRNTDIFSKYAEKQQNGVLETTDETEPGTLDKDVSKESPTTKDQNKNRELGKIIGRKRRAGRVLSCKAQLLIGSVIPRPAMTVNLDCHSAYFSGTYVIETVEHSLSTSGFETNLEMRRPRPKTKSKGNRDSETQSSKQEQSKTEEPNNEQTGRANTGNDIFGENGFGSQDQAAVLNTEGKATR
jgi:phage protein D